MAGSHPVFFIMGGEMVTRASFRTLFPEFDSLSDNMVDAVIRTAKMMQTRNTLAQEWLTAHLLALVNGEDGDEAGKPDGGMGEVTSETIGPLMRQYRTQAGLLGGSDVFFTTTRYGRTFLQVIKRDPVNTFKRVIVA